MKKPTFNVEYNSQTAIIPLPHTGYLDKVLRSSSYEELMWRFMGCDSPAKEITESYAAFSNLKRYCRINNYHWFHIGDGAHTRTAALFTFMSKSLNHSIDPAININKYLEWRNKYNVKNIYICPHEFQKFSIPLATIGLEEKPYSITCVHAHVNLEEVDKKLPDWHYLYTNPCCHPERQVFSEKYMEENNIECLMDRQDLGIWSERRIVRVYVNHRVCENKPVKDVFKNIK